MIVNFSKASISPSIVFVLYFKSSRWKIAIVARNLINYVPQKAATTVAFSSV